ncbi:hypothetical protein CBOM_08030 [Ceraceosorus bombacis]|uniref:Uncharacterized protein n=1 Tax=Ceraceosorus bombacis TaxID=401625 RepID=A0A0P1BBC8_9BASI|nr:hypothetical protein CBOM_08030 [Ceraceosorus bombacis]
MVRSECVYVHSRAARRRFSPGYTWQSCFVNWRYKSQCMYSFPPAPILSNFLIHARLSHTHMRDATPSVARSLHPNCAASTQQATTLAPASSTAERGPAPFFAFDQSSAEPAFSLQLYSCHATVQASSAPLCRRLSSARLWSDSVTSHATGVCFQRPLAEHLFLPTTATLCKELRPAVDLAQVLGYWEETKSAHSLIPCALASQSGEKRVIRSPVQDINKPTQNTT